ncbi:MAG: hypothetical protein IPP88_12040 [Betaproteobacteria bacterium]|jgi:hypothetical protein|nr:hypothetical protein [Betaproteobacteria bacterium]
MTSSIEVDDVIPANTVSNSLELETITILERDPSPSALVHTIYLRTVVNA